MPQRLAVVCAYIKNSTFALASAIQKEARYPAWGGRWIRVYSITVSQGLQQTPSSASMNTCRWGHLHYAPEPSSRQAAEGAGADLSPGHRLGPAPPPGPPLPRRPAEGPRAPGLGEGADPACRTPSHPSCKPLTALCLPQSPLSSPVCPHRSHPGQALLVPPSAVSSSAVAPPTASPALARPPWPGAPAFPCTCTCPAPCGPWGP